MPFPFEATLSEIEASLDVYVDSVFSCLESDFLLLPKGPGFVEYPVFEKGYEALKQATRDFSDLSPQRMLDAIVQTPMAFIVLRSILGFTPPEWAYLTSLRGTVQVTQGSVRTLDRKIRMAPLEPLRLGDLMRSRLQALVQTASELIQEGASNDDAGKVHRLDKADTSDGPAGIQNLSRLGVPYAMLLYERLLGRPFAGHRDSVSEIVGDSMEAAVENVLSAAAISYRKTKRAERLPGFDQAPDFVIPDEFNPAVVIEAKITEDDGTARDKVTRIQHLHSLSMAGQPSDCPKYEVVACIGGRGFGVRREDMKKMLLATRGKVFTFKTLPHLVEFTGLSDFQVR